MNYNNDVYNVYSKDIRSGNVNNIYRQTYKKHIIINSSFRDDYLNNSSNNFIITLPTPVKNLISMKVVECILPKNIYNISDKYNNNKINISGSVIEISNGFYDKNTLQTEINQKLTEESLSDISLSYNEISNKFKFSHINSNNFNIKLFDIDNNCGNFRNNIIDNQNSLGWILGFRGYYNKNNLQQLNDNYINTNKNSDLSCYYLKKNDIGENIIHTVTRKIINNLDINKLQEDNNFYESKNNYEAEAAFNDNFNNNFYISINDFRNNNNSSIMLPFKKSELINKDIIFSGKIRNDNINDINNNCERIYFSPIELNRLEIKLFNEFGILLDINNLDFILKLELDILYE